MYNSNSDAFLDRELFEMPAVLFAQALDVSPRICNMISPSEVLVLRVVCDNERRPSGWCLDGLGITC